MNKLRLKCLCIGFLCCSFVLSAQMADYSSERVDADVAMDRALKSSSLTYDGKPFMP
jgi:hypothetical protein